MKEGNNVAVLIAKKLTAFFIQYQVIKDTDKDTYEYCFQVLLLNVLNFGTVLFLAIILGRITETILYMAGFFLIRKQAGGFHARTPLRCYLLSVANYMIFILILSFISPTWIDLMNMGIIILAFLIIWRYAPIADKNKPFSIGEYERYKRNSRLIISTLVILNFIACNISIINIQVYMLPLDLGILFAAVSLLYAKTLNKDNNIIDNL
jgi:accessory gene regulator B